MPRRQVGAAEEVQRLIVQRLHAQRGAVDPGSGQVGEARRLDEEGWPPA